MITLNLKKKKKNEVPKLQHPKKSKRLLISCSQCQTFDLLYLQGYKTTVGIGLPSLWYLSSQLKSMSLTQKQMRICFPIVPNNKGGFIMANGLMCSNNPLYIHVSYASLIYPELQHQDEWGENLIAQGQNKDAFQMPKEESRVSLL